jgi:hypothetical protein
MPKFITDNMNRDFIMGKHDTGEQNENYKMFTEFYTFNDLVIEGTLFPHKSSIRPSGFPLTVRPRIELTIIIIIGRKWRRSLRRVKIGVTQHQTTTWLWQYSRSI